MKMLFLTLLYKKEEEKHLLAKSKCGLQGAVNTFQWAIIKGLDEILESPIQLLNTLPVGTYPKYYRDLLIKSEVWEHYCGAKDKNIGFINLLGFKQLIREINYYKDIKKWIEINKDEEELCILIYSLYTPFLKAINRIKKNNSNVKTCVIIPDLPNQFGIEKNDNKLFNYIRILDGKSQLKLIKFIDKFVLLTEDMKYPLKIKDKDYTIIEGIFNNDINIKLDNKIINEDNKVILYTGTLNKQFGIDRLLKAFSLIKSENYKLWICGNGDMVDEIKKLSKIDDRIIFHGYLVREEVIKLQHLATVLINPRINDGEYVKYSFPSKTMEYIASGTPLIAYKLDGIPKEYYDYIYFVDDDSIESLKEKIIEICEKNFNERYDFGKRAKNFILKEKNYKVQTNKLLDLLK